MGRFPAMIGGGTVTASRGLRCDPERMQATSWRIGDAAHDQALGRFKRQWLRGLCRLERVRWQVGSHACLLQARPARRWKWRPRTRAAQRWATVIIRRRLRGAALDLFRAQCSFRLRDGPDPH